MNSLNLFFKDLAEKLSLPTFFRSNTLILNNLFLTLVAAFCLIALLLVIFLVPGKKKKAKKQAEKSTASAAVVKAPTEDAPVQVAPIEEVPTEETASEPIAEVPTEEVAEETTEEAVAVEPTPVPKATPVEESVEEPTLDEEDRGEPEEKGKTGGKYEIVKRNDAFYFLLKANNGQLLLESSAYTTLVGARNGIDTFKNAVEVGEFAIDEDKNGNFKFILRASARSQMLYHGETYSTRQRAESAIGSVKNFAFTTVVKRVKDDDEDESAATPVETKPLKEAEHKAGGKYEIEERNGCFYFLLKANNGQLLLESPAFTTEQGAKSGIDTFKKAADTGFFVVDVDKKGKFRFILRAGARSQMRYFGESYSTRQSAENSVHSVRAFAQNAVLK